MRIYYLMFLMFIVSCTSKVEKSNLQFLNGYWEIEKVELPDGSDKEYKINESVDYFKIDEDLKGFRKKLVPQFDGKLLTNDVNEEVFVTFEEDKIYLNYATEFAKWKEEILVLNATNLRLKNNQDIIYNYKKKEITNE